MAILLGVEPVTAEELAVQRRIAAPTLEAERAYYEGVLIPAARQEAETRSGSAIMARSFTYRMASPAAGAVLLPMGNAYAVDSVTCAGAPVDSSEYSLRIEGSLGAQQGWLDVPRWPALGAVEIVYKAGIDIAGFPSVKSWILLAAAWLDEHREEPMPQNFVEALLAPITIPPRI